MNSEDGMKQHRVVRNGHVRRSHKTKVKAAEAEQRKVREDEDRERRIVGTYERHRQCWARYFKAARGAMKICNRQKEVVLKTMSQFAKAQNALWHL